MHVNIENFWKKSIENRKVCLLAMRYCHFNAAANRYYYALYLAIRAFFMKKNIKGKKRKDKEHGLYYEEWKHGDLIRRAGIHLDSTIVDIKNILDDAKEQREIGDYEQRPVSENRLKSVRRRAKKVFKVILNAIRS